MPSPGSSGSRTHYHLQQHHQKQQKQQRFVSARLNEDKIVTFLVLKRTSESENLLKDSEIFRLARLAAGCCSLRCESHRYSINTDTFSYGKSLFWYFF